VPELGVDGFYASTQGGEAGTFRDPRLFGRYVTPYDLRLMKEIDETCRFNILHVCDYEPRTPTSRPSPPTRATW